MDLVIYKEDEIIIIDFKTDTTDNENKLIDMYAAQLQTYKHSMERITDSPIKTYIYAFLYLNASFYNNLCYNGGSFEKREGERFMEKFFKLNEKGSNVKTELIAGLTTFLAMAYILGVNPAVLADAGMDKASVFLCDSYFCWCGKYHYGTCCQLPSCISFWYGCKRIVRLHNLWTNGP